MPMTTLPTPPSRGDSPADFASKADALLGALPTFVTEANALQTDVSSKQATASSAATTASTQAGVATSAATTATTQAGNASSSASAAAASFNAFDARYLGSKTSAPSVDNLGGALVTGALYWNSTLGKMYVWTGSAWITNDVLNAIVAGDLSFTGSGARIKADFSNATIANRAMFQTSTVNGNTTVSVIPNGTGTASGIATYSKSDTSNSEALSAYVASGSAAVIVSDKTGTGTYLPMAFYTGGSERLRLTTGGVVSAASASPPAFQAGSFVSGAGMYGCVGAYNSFTANRYFDGSVWRNIATGASQYFQIQPGGFQFVASTAGAAAGATPTDDFTVLSADNNGGSTFNGRANMVLHSNAVNGYGAFYAKSSGTNASYVFFGDAGGEKGRISSATDGSMVFSRGNAATTTMSLDGSGNATFAGTVTATNLFGQNQTWQDVSASRANNTVYTNTTSRPIQISYSAVLATSTYFLLQINGVTVASGATGAIGSQATFNNVIPAGATYQIVTTGTPTRQAWAELR